MIIPFGGLILQVEFWSPFSYCGREFDMETSWRIHIEEWIQVEEFILDDKSDTMTAYCSNLESFFRNWFTTCNGGALNYLRVRENGKYYQCILLYITLHYELNKHNPELKIVSLSTSVSCGSCNFFCIKFSWNSFLTFWLSMTSVCENGRDYSPFSPLPSPPPHSQSSFRAVWVTSACLLPSEIQMQLCCSFFCYRVLKWELKVIDKL